jgi:hypothetical protein
MLIANKLHGFQQHRKYVDYLADKRASMYLLQHATISWRKYTVCKRSRVRQETEAMQRFACRRAEVLLCKWERERLLQQVAHANFVRVARAFMSRCLRRWHVHVLAVNKGHVLLCKQERAGALSSLAAWHNLICAQETLAMLGQRAHSLVLVGRMRMCVAAWRSRASMCTVCDAATDKAERRLCVRILGSVCIPSHEPTCNFCPPFSQCSTPSAACSHIQNVTCLAAISLETNALRALPQQERPLK